MQPEKAVRFIEWFSGLIDRIEHGEIASKRGPDFVVIGPFLGNCEPPCPCEGWAQFRRPLPDWAEFFEDLGATCRKLRAIHGTLAELERAGIAVTGPDLLEILNGPGKEHATEETANGNQNDDSHN